MLKRITPLLQVRDLDASVAFYVHTLGFKASSPEGGFCQLERDDCSLFLAQKTKDVDVSNKVARAVDDGWCNYDLHFHCQPGALNTLFDEFKSKGAPMPACYQNGPILRSYGVRDFSVIDPDGYDLVFGEEVPEA